MPFRTLYYLILLITVPYFGIAQYPKPKIEVGPGNINVGENMTISVLVFGPEYHIGDFPDIKGFEKGSRFTSHSEITENGEVIETHRVLRHYKALTDGVLEIPEFDILVNGESYIVPASSIIATADGEDFSELRFSGEEAEFRVSTSKKSIYTGEGVKVRLSFYISQKNTKEWKFLDDKDLTAQIEDFAKKIKPENSLENRKTISSISQREEQIKGEKYYVYDLFEAVYYPLNIQDINIPALTLKMLKDEEITYLRSRPQSIKIRELPEHTLKEKVVVGSLKLKEIMDGEWEKSTGKSFDFNVSIEGIGNLRAVNLLKEKDQNDFEFFEASVDLNQRNGELFGSKDFKLKILPKVAGIYDLGDYLSLIYFNTSSSTYDTLKVQSKLLIFGPTLETNDNFNQDIYHGLSEIATDKLQFNVRRFFISLANGFLVLMILFLIYILKKK